MFKDARQTLMLGIIRSTRMWIADTIAKRRFTQMKSEPLPKVKDAVELSVALLAQCTVSATDRIGGRGTRDAQGWEGLGSKQRLPIKLPKFSQALVSPPCSKSITQFTQFVFI